MEIAAQHWECASCHRSGPPISKMGSFLTCLILAFLKHLMSKDLVVRQVTNVSFENLIFKPQQSVRLPPTSISLQKSPGIVIQREAIPFSVTEKTCSALTQNINYLIQNNLSKSPGSVLDCRNWFKEVIISFLQLVSVAVLTYIRVMGWEGGLGRLVSCHS